MAGPWPIHRPGGGVSVAPVEAGRTGIAPGIGRTPGVPQIPMYVMRESAYLAVNSTMLLGLVGI